MDVQFVLTVLGDSGRELVYLSGGFLFLILFVSLVYNFISDSLEN